MKIIYYVDKDSYYDFFLDQVRDEHGNILPINEFLENLGGMDTEDFNHRDHLFEFLKEEGIEVIKKELTEQVVDEYLTREGINQEVIDKCADLLGIPRMIKKDS